MFIDSVSSIRTILRDLEVVGATVMPGFLSEKAHERMLAALKGLSFVDMPTVVGDHNTEQYYRRCVTFDEDSIFCLCAEKLAHALRERFSGWLPAVLPYKLEFNELILQDYTRQGLGIAPHLDGKGCVNLIVVLVLAGAGRFFITKDRQGTDPIEIRNRPRDLILMRGTGLFGDTTDRRPFHFLTDVDERGRKTLGMRQRIVRPTTQATTGP